MANTFAAWLNKELEIRGWSFRELARRSELSPTVISDVANSRLPPGLSFCVQTARAFNIQPEQILRQAGLLPSLPPAVEEETEALALLRNLPTRTRELILMQLRALAGRAQPAVSSPQLAGSPLTALERQLLDEFRRLPPAGQRLALENVESLQQYHIRIIGEEDETETEAQAEQAA